MTTALPEAVRRPLARPWPLLPRALAGAAAGFVIARWLVSDDAPSWTTPVAVLLMAAAAAGAPSTARADALGGAPLLALASAIGLYGGVPETDRVVGLAAGLAAFAVAELMGSARTSALTVVVLSGTLVAAVLDGGVGREPATIAGFATLGLLVLWPVAVALPGPSTPLVPGAALRSAIVTGLHAVTVVIIGRQGAVVESRPKVVLIVIVGSGLLVLAVRLAVGARAHAMKRAGDLVLGSAILVLTAPLTIAVALAVRLIDGRPILFRQVRSGRGGVPFALVKFRTMRPSADTRWRPANDSARTTRLGALLRSTSLDELPTLVHVVRGDMSLVGPRPLPVDYLDRYDDDQARRLEVRPGVTGWAQVNGRNELDWADRLELDVWYVDHRSTGLDLRILARTVGQVLRRRGVDQREGVTMSEFRGRAGT